MAKMSTPAAMPPLAGWDRAAIALTDAVAVGDANVSVEVEDVVVQSDLSFFR